MNDGRMQMPVMLLLICPLNHSSFSSNNHTPILTNSASLNH